MLKTSIAFSLVLGLSLTASVAAALPVSKCVVNGTTTYQQGPCASEATRKLPTVQALNAEEQRRRASAVAAPAGVGASSAATVQQGFSCDGRKYCSQMKSCAEAKYFLSHCPAVKMDGDKNGIPCEQQWCMR
ncbi:MAG: excalibur calcium-binding domain-containing protein [Variovorax sp.]|nr:MAG: excalibur calcium-binding domain-containing protein [Variovorax sp.]